MTASKVTRKVYSAEELHRLRNTQSQPKLREAIEEHDSEDAEVVKEHVLRGSKSFAARSFRSRASGNSLRVPSNRSNNENFSAIAPDASRLFVEPVGLNAHPTGSILGEIPPNGQVIRQGGLKLRPSPTPSMKRKKAEAIVKAHGSPQHIRVTAGGRIVPSEQSPLCHPRYGYSAIKTNGGLIKFAPNHHAGTPDWTQATRDGYVAQDVHGNLCQIVNGTILPLEEVDGALRLYMPAPNLNITQRGSSVGPINPPFTQNGGQQRAPSQGKCLAAPEPPIASQVSALELEYGKLEHELKDVDKTEVIHGRTMGKVSKDALITKRRELVTNMDKIRKALKELKSRPPPNAPTSPRAMQTRASMSPPRNRLPAFLQMQPANNRMPAAQAPPSYGPFFGGPPPQFGGQFGAQQTPSPDEIYGTQSWMAPPPGMFIPPPPFDGSMAPPFATYPPTAPTSEQIATAPIGTDGKIPQKDGARSLADLQAGSPSRPHAVSIKAPEPKPATNLKSCLNPMSPVYKPATRAAMTAADESASTKPVKGRVATPLSPLRQLRPPAQPHKPSNATDETISPAKKTAHLHSSSISSFETADFFPRNTREYSTRQHAYPFHASQSEDKENTNPEASATERETSPLTSGQGHYDSSGNHSSTEHSYKDYSPHAGRFKATAAPPGTPVHPDDNSKPSLPVALHGEHFDVPNRGAHNVSPKCKREFLFVQEHPDRHSQQPSSSPEKIHTCQDELCVTSSPSDTIDFAEKPREWIEGYQAGLQRKPVGRESQGDFLDGYCSGLLKSKPVTTGLTSVAPSTGSPMRSLSRRPSPALPSRTSSRLQLAEKPLPIRPPFESAMESLDTLKQAVFAPQNENTILTPAPDGPHITEQSFNLGAWAKNQGRSSHVEVASASRLENVPGYPFPHRQSSVIKRQGIMSEDNADYKQQIKAMSQDARRLTDSNTPYLSTGGPAEFSGNLAAQPASPTLSTMSIASSSLASGSAPGTGNRVTSIDSNLYRPWPSHRIITPTEWKSSSSVAHVAGLATGYFANAQFDGTHDAPPTLRIPGQLTGDVTSAGAPQSQLQRANSVMSSSTIAPQQGRFREGSLDGMSNPPMSPPLISPNGTPIKDSGKKKSSSPAKGQSPAKAKFEHIAEKVGIKVSASSGKPVDGSADNFEPGSPPGKRRWRDVWRKGGRDGTE